MSLPEGPAAPAGAADAAASLASAPAASAPAVSVEAAAGAAGPAPAGVAPAAPQPSALDALRAASAGLLLPSESDAPFEVLALAGPPSAGSLREASGLGADAPVAAQTLDALLGPLGAERASHDEAEKAEAGRFRALHAAVARLADVSVFRVGAVDVDVWITGRDGDTWLALKSHVVET